QPGKKTKDTEALRKRFLEQAVKEAAHTWVNRLVLLRILEQHELVTPAVLTGGWKSPAYDQEFIHYAGPLAQDDTRGYRDLLDTVFGELALELPGLYGPVGLVALFPMPGALLRELVQALNEPALDSAWGDDMTLGWVYQYWNDPEREQLDAKIADGGKIEPHEIASKTQMFTERYMVEWLLQNSLGLTWLSLCKKQGWRAEAESILPALEQRRAAFRKQREAGEVALDALMPLHGELEHAWKYYVPQPIPEDAVARAPASIREVKLLDPACGSGHFLVSAFGLFVAMYREEAKLRGETWSDDEIAASILANNLHGVDIDARAIQIAAAALWLKAKQTAPNAKLGRMNLVAPCFRLGALPKDDPAVKRLYSELDALGVPSEATRELVESLSGVDHLGTLLRVGDTTKTIVKGTGEQWGSLFANAAAKKQIELDTAIAQFLDAHATEADLGLRLEGEQLAAGLRFVRLVKEGTYDVVVGNPPYQGLSKTAQFDYVTKNYPRGKADLYAAFLERGLELARQGGLSAMVTMQGWMFLGQFADLRQWTIEDNRLSSLVDLRWCAFENMRHATVSMTVVARGAIRGGESVALCPTPREDREESIPALAKKRAAVLAQVGRYEFDPKGFEVIEGEPIVYWWTREFLERYAKAPKLGNVSPARFGLTTGDNERFVHFWHEVHDLRPLGWRHAMSDLRAQAWAPFVLGGKGRLWFEPFRDVCRWYGNGLEVKEKCVSQYGTVSKQIRNEDAYFRRGAAFAMIGATFSGRAHRYPSVIGNMGSSVYPVANALAATVTLMNRQ
ncbi:MAG TPA: BREX-6 system adenine-specific DNA-methyltransferase PglX, partial [Polyangiaceae bacterium]